MVAFAMLCSILGTYRSNKKLVATYFVCGIYVLIGVSATFHWISDALAGAIIGTSIGLTIRTGLNNGQYWETSRQGFSRAAETPEKTGASA